MKRRLGLRIGLVLGLLGLLATGGLVALREWARWYVSPHGTRLLFHEWTALDRGWAWSMDPGIEDPGGTLAFADRHINMILVLLTNDGQLTSYLRDMGPDQATLLGGTPYATSVTAEPNTLLIVSFPSRQERRFALEPGVAGEVRDELAFECLEAGEALPGIVRLYRGPDQPSLEAFLAELPEGEAKEQAVNSVPP